MRESDEMARVCVELMVGSGCQRPIVLRLRTTVDRFSPLASYSDGYSADGEWVWRVGVGGTSELKAVL